jgi:hypothetical protein
MVLPGSGILSVQDIENEWLIGTAITKTLNGNLGPLIAIAPTVTTSIGSFHGKAYARAVTGITQGTTTSSSIVLNWSGGGAGATSFTITSSPATTTQTASATGYNFTGLASSTSYTFTIVSNNAQNVAGQSAVSGSFTTSSAGGVSGNPEWTVTTNMGLFGGTYGNRCAADNVAGSNFVYLLGACTTTQFSAWNTSASQFNSTYVATTLGAAGLIKYSNTGSVSWLTTIDGAGNDLAGAGIDQTTNFVYISGRAGTTFPKAYNAGSATVGVTTTTSSSGTTGYFIVKYNKSGVAQWMVGAGNSGGGGTNASGMCVDPSDNVYGGWRRGGTGGTVCYQYYAASAGVFQTGTTGNISTSLAGAIGKWNSAGTPLWNAAISANVAAGQVNSICWDNTNSKLYCSGAAGGLSVIRAFNAVSSNTVAISIASANVNSVQLPLTTASSFVAAYNTSGTALWISVINNVQAAFQGGAFVATGGGSLYVLGSTASGGAPTAYNAGTTTGTTAAKTPTLIGAFLAKYNTLGVVQWITVIDGAGDNLAGGLAVYNSNVYIQVIVPSGTGLVAYNAGSSSVGITVQAMTTGGNGTALIKYYSNGVPHTSTMMENAGVASGNSVQGAPAISPLDGAVYMPAIGQDVGVTWIGWGTDQSTQTVSSVGGFGNGLTKYTAF